MEFELKNVVDRVIKEATASMDIYNFDLDRCIAKHAAPLAELSDGRERIAYVVENVNNMVDEHIRDGLPKGADQHYEFKVANPPEFNHKFDKTAEYLPSNDFAKAPIDNLARAEVLQKKAAQVAQIEFPVKHDVPEITGFENFTQLELVSTSM